MPLSRIQAIVMAAGPGRRMGKITSFGPGVHFGNMPKPTVPIVNKPIISRTVEQLVGFGVTDFWVTSHHMAGDVLKILGHGDRFGAGVRIRHYVEFPLVHTAKAVKEISKKFDKKQPFWVVGGDIFSPNTDFPDFHDGFRKAQAASRGVIGGVGFILRPAEDLIFRYGTAILGRNGCVESFVDAPHSKEEASKIFDEIKDPRILRLSDRLKKELLPINSSIYLLTNQVFEQVPEPETNPTDLYDFGFYVFMKLRSRAIYGHIIPEAVHDRELVRVWTDVGLPEDIWRANFRLIRHAPHLIGGNYVPSLGSWVEPGCRIKGEVHNSVIGGNVFIGPGVKVTESVIGSGSTLEGVNEVSGSVLFPYTYVNTRRYARKVDLIARSLVISRPQGGSFIDQHSTGNHLLEKRMVVPNMDGQLMLEDLHISDRDARELLDKS